VWDAYVRGLGGLPVVKPAVERVARSMTVDLLGFWMAWLLLGGFEGLVESGMHPSTVWRKVKRFRVAFGAHPDEFEFPGVSVDPVAYWEAARRAETSKG
jgi:hypothetical protein